MKKGKNKLFKIIITCIMCFLCTFSFVGCFPSGGGGGSGSGSGGSSSGGSSGGSGSGGGNTDSGTTSANDPNINDLNEVMLGAIGVYELDKAETCFYDKYTDTNMSFNQLLDRQFTVMSNYIYYTLKFYYGTSTEQQVALTNAYGKDLQLNLVDAINNEEPHKSIILDTDPSSTGQSTYLYYKGSITGKYKQEWFDSGDAAKPGSQYVSASGDGSPAWKENGFDTDSAAVRIEWIKKYLIDIANNPIDTGDLNIDSSFNNTALKNAYNNTNTPTATPNYDNINSLGLSKELLINVSYFIAYRIIGEEGINNSLNAQSVVISGNQINYAQCTQANSTKFQNYKGYNIVIPKLLENISKMSVPSSSVIEFKEDNALTTLFPRLKAEKYIFYDNVEDVSDSYDPNPEPDYSSYDPENPPELLPIIPGMARPLKEIIYIPNISSEGITVQDPISKEEKKVSIDDFQIKYVFFGMQTLSDSVNVGVDYEFCYNNGSKSSEGSKLFFTTYPDTEDFDWKEDVIVYHEQLVDDNYDVNTDYLGGALYEDAESNEGKQRLKDCRFGNATLKNKNEEETKVLISNSFKKETVKIPTSGRDILVGNLNVYNNLFDENLELNFSKNYLKFIFKYYDESLNLLTTIPSLYLMSFTPTN